MKALQYRLYLKAPLLVPGILGEPNSAVSLSYIPGSQIRGALIKAYLRHQKSLRPDLLADKDAYRRFFSGEVRFLNAYPQNPDKKRMLPTPRSWLVEKRKEKPIYDAVLEKEKEDSQRSADNTSTKRKAVSAEFCSLEGGCVLFSPRRQINIHTARDPIKGRATRGKGAVFRYDALAAGQCFIGVILFENSARDDLATFKGLLANAEFWLGGSRTAGYGRVTTVGEIEEATNWHEIGADKTSHQGIPPEEEFRVTLLSDALIRDEQTGQYTNDLTETLERALGVSLQRPKQKRPEQKAYWDISLIGGFNRKWGLPRDQEVAITAGSVFVFKANQMIAGKKIEKLIEQGVGERRIDGFGRLTVNWLNQYQYTNPNYWSGPNGTGVPIALAADEDKGIALTMVERIYRAHLDRSLAAMVNQIQTKNPPKNSQLSQFRLVCRKAAQQGWSLKPLEDHLENALRRKASGEQLQNARVAGQPMDKWIRECLAEVKGLLRDHQPLMIGGITLNPERLEALGREYKVRLIDGVLHKAALTPDETESNDNE